MSCNGLRNVGSMKSIAKKWSFELPHAKLFSHLLSGITNMNPDHRCFGIKGIFRSEPSEYFEMFQPFVFHKVSTTYKKSATLGILLTFQLLTAFLRHRYPSMSTWMSRWVLRSWTWNFEEWMKVVNFRRKFRDTCEISKVCRKDVVSVEFVASVSLWNVFKNTGPWSVLPAVPVQWWPAMFVNHQGGLLAPPSPSE